MTQKGILPHNNNLFQVLPQLPTWVLLGAAGLRVHVSPGLDQRLVRRQLRLQQPQHVLEGGGAV